MLLLNTVETAINNRRVPDVATALLCVLSGILPRPTLVSTTTILSRVVFPLVCCVSATVSCGIKLPVCGYSSVTTSVCVRRPHPLFQGQCEIEYVGHVIDIGSSRQLLQPFLEPSADVWIIVKLMIYILHIKNN